MAEKSVGLIELSSIAAGFQVADTMLKASNVRLLLSRSICSGVPCSRMVGAAHQPITKSGRTTPAAASS